MCKTCWETCIYLWQSLQSIFMASAGNIVSPPAICVCFIPFLPATQLASDFSLVVAVRACPLQSRDIGPLVQHFVTYGEKGSSCMSKILTLWPSVVSAGLKAFCAGVVKTWLDKAMSCANCECLNYSQFTCNPCFSSQAFWIHLPDML